MFDVEFLFVCSPKILWISISKIKKKSFTPNKSSCPKNFYKFADFDRTSSINKIKVIILLSNTYMNECVCINVPNVRMWTRTHSGAIAMLLYQSSEPISLWTFPTHSEMWMNFKFWFDQNEHAYECAQPYITHLTIG